MKTYEYWDHSQYPHYPGQLVFSVSLPNNKTITDADQLFSCSQGKDPRKLSHIGCKIKETSR